VATIDGDSTRELPLWEIQELLAGESGSRVEMELLRLGEEVKVSFELAPYTVPEASLERVERDGVVAGVLHVGRFDDVTAERVKGLLAEAREAGYDRLLVDLRNSADGEAEKAYPVAALFAEGELGRLVKRDETLSTYTGDDEPAWSGRLVVTVNRGTLGAAEVLASVLRQKADAELVGEGTFGYAGRQDLAELSGGGRLFYTGAFYTGPDGVPLAESLQPDDEVTYYSRTYEERELPAYELIYRRGLERLFHDAAEETMQRAA
jgi:carboxyl-terminal processing protease